MNHEGSGMMWCWLNFPLDSSFLRVFIVDLFSLSTSFVLGLRARRCALLIFPFFKTFTRKELSFHSLICSSPIGEILQWSEWLGRTNCGNLDRLSLSSAWYFFEILFSEDGGHWRRTMKVLKWFGVDLTFHWIHPSYGYLLLTCSICLRHLECEWEQDDVHFSSFPSSWLWVLKSWIFHSFP